jgi:hypothetical protein
MEQNGIFEKVPEKLDREVWSLLQSNGTQQRTWFPFSFGGTSSWERRISGERLALLVREPLVLDVRRELKRTGEVLLRLTYEAGEESVPCDKIMTLLDLPSCPDAVRHADSRHYVFSGMGRGHGLGLSLERARYLSLQGKSAADILRDACASSG